MPNPILYADRVFAARRAAVRASAAADLPALIASAREAATATKLDPKSLGDAGDALSNWRESNAADPMSETALAVSLIARDARDRGIDAKKHADVIRAAVLAACDLAELAGKSAR